MFKPATVAYPVLLCLAFAGCARNTAMPVDPAQFASTDRTDAAHDFRVLHAFAGAPKDGAGPDSLIYADGELIGTTVNGGKYQNIKAHRAGGTIFQLSPDGSESLLYDFGSGKQNDPPFDNSLFSADGNIYGVDASENLKTQNTAYLYRLSKNALVQLHEFKTAAAIPLNVTDIGGVLYGSAPYGGKHNCGELDKLSTSGMVKIVHAFTCSSDGAQPSGPVVRIGSTLYGAASMGGPSGGGTVYAVTAAGAERTVYAFSDAGSGYSHPRGALVDAAGRLYGVLGYGEASGGSAQGAIFSVTRGGSYATLLPFTDAATQGSFPSGSLVYAQGKLYGTTLEGGTYGYGTVFSLTLSGKETLLHSFNKNVDGYNPDQLIYANGRLYGVTQNFGPKGHGTIFTLKP